MGYKVLKCFLLY